MTDPVGYGKPPTHTRFQKGQSGNPRGRPKGVGDFHKDLLAELAETIQVTEGGKVKRITKQRALIKALTTGGIKGDARATNVLLALVARSLASGSSAQTQAGPTPAEQKILEAWFERQIDLRLAKRLGGP